MDDFPSLTTERMTLRQVRHSDAGDVLAIRGDEQAMRLMGRDPLHSLEQAHHQIAQFLTQATEQSPAFRWVLERTTDKIVLGTCGVFGWVKPWRKCSIGYELGHFAWGQGYMQEAASAILCWAFENMHLHRVDALIHPDNHSSRKLVERLGFQSEGRLRETAYWNQNYHDMLQFGLLQPEMISPSSSFKN